MKLCRKCKENKKESEFGKHASTKDKLQYDCRKCRNSYGKVWYESNSETHKNRVRVTNKKAKNLIREFLIEYLSNNPCMDCGNSNPIVLEFDHRIPEDKSFGVSRMVQRGMSLEKIKLEIAKCDVRCANCHKIRTAEQFNWYKTRKVVTTG